MRFRVRVLGFGFWVLGLGFGVWGFGFWVLALWGLRLLGVFTELQGFARFGSFLS